MTLDKKQKPEKRVTVRVNPDLHKAAKIEAAKEGKSLSDKLREMLEAWTQAKK